MGHFFLTTAAGQVHLYCRDADTYEGIFEAAEQNGTLTQVRGGGEDQVPHSDQKIHLYIKESKIFAVNKDGSAHKGKTFKLPEVAADELKKALPALKLRKDKRLPTAPFAASLLPVLTDF